MVPALARIVRASRRPGPAVPRAGLGSTNGQRSQVYLDSAKFYAADVIKNSAFQLMPKYSDLFLTANNNNPEQLFQFACLSLQTAQNTIDSPDIDYD